MEIKTLETSRLCKLENIIGRKDLLITEILSILAYTEEFPSSNGLFVQRIGQAFLLYTEVI